MRSLLTFVLAAILSLSLGAADLAGTWTGEMETQMGKTAISLTFAPGAALTGKASLGDYEGKIENATLAGDRISFDVTIEHGKLAFQGTTSATEMKLNVTGIQGDKSTLTCKRQK